jgi:benzoyl-CoA reductase/2-hydroxyglutaryl-CoA dehydratase subunit BcrC/BadD/HgdB
MSNFEDVLNNALLARKEQLVAKSSEGTPVIGFITQYVPLELLAASDAEYIAWEWFIHLYGVSEAYAKDQIPNQYLSRDICAYSRSVFALEVNSGPRLNRLYTVYTCDMIAKISEYLEAIHPTVYLDIPRWQNENTQKLWRYQFLKLKKDLESLTNTTIEDERLKQEILKEKRIKEKLAGIFKKSLTTSFPLSSGQLHRLVQYRYLLSSDDYLNLIDFADNLIEEYSTQPLEEGPAKPIIFIMGSPFVCEARPGVLLALFCGEDIVEFVEQLGGKAVDETFRDILFDTMPDPSLVTGDILDTLSDHYYQKPVNACVLSNFDKRLKKNGELAKWLNAACALYFNFKGCPVFLAEIRLMEDALFKEGIPMQHLQISGELSEQEILRTRIESFLYTKLSN